MGNDSRWRFGSHNLRPIAVASIDEAVRERAKRSAKTRASQGAEGGLPPRERDESTASGGVVSPRRRSMANGRRRGHKCLLRTYQIWYVALGCRGEALSWNRRWRSGSRRFRRRSLVVRNSMSIYWRTVDPC